MGTVGVANVKDAGSNATQEPPTEFGRSAVDGIEKDNGLGISKKPAGRS